MNSPTWDTIVTYFQILFGVISCCGTIVAPLYLIPATLRDPFARKRDRTKKIDYSLLDISCLFVLMAVTMAVVRLLFVNERSAGRAMGGMIFFAGLALVVWWTSIRSLSRANVTSNQQRLIFLLGVTPIVWIVSFILPGSICFSFITIVSNDTDNGRFVVLLLMSVGGIAILIVCRKVVRSIYSNIDGTSLERKVESH